MGGFGDRMLAAIEHRIIEQAKKAYDAGKSSRSWLDCLLQAVEECPEVVKGNVQAVCSEAVSGAWVVAVDYPEPDPREPCEP